MVYLKLNKIKGALGLLTIAATIWFFWMSYEWLRNRGGDK